MNEALEAWELPWFWAERRERKKTLSNSEKHNGVEVKES